MELECRTVVDRGSDGRGTERWQKAGGGSGHTPAVYARHIVTSRPETRLVQRTSSRMLRSEFLPKVSPKMKHRRILERMFSRSLCGSKIFYEDTASQPKLWMICCTILWEVSLVPCSFLDNEVNKVLNFLSKLC